MPFPKLANRGKIDVFLGTDNYHLMYPKKEMIGGAGEPCARLCLLGWTAVDRINMENTGTDHNTSLSHSGAPTARRVVGKEPHRHHGKS